MFLLFLEKIWGRLRPHVPTVLITLLFVAVCYAGYLHVKKMDEGIAKKLQEMQKIHDDEVAAIKDAQKVEREQHQANIKQLQKSLEDIKTTYDAKLLELEKKKTESVNGLISTWQVDPSGVAMAKKLGEILKFNVLLPEGKK